MGTLFSSLDIARSGLTAAQIQLDTAGHNIANATNPNFSRQRVELLSRNPVDLIVGKIGRGVQVGQIARIRDSFLDASFRDQVQLLGEARIRAEFFAQVEDVFLEPGENGVSGRISVFFDALSEFASNVESFPVRQSVVNEAEALANTFNEVYRQLEVIRSGANQQVVNLVPVINGLGEQIADLNFRISKAELDGNPANDLRDQRDGLLDELGELVDITVREREDGTVDVLLSDQQFVFSRFYRELETAINPALDAIRNDFVDIQFVDSGEVLTVRSGELYGAIDTRDNGVNQVIDEINTLAATIIQQINLVHAQGNGITNYSGTVTSTFGPDDPNLSLQTVTGLDLPIGVGSFDFTLYDAAGNVVLMTPVDVLGGMSLTTLRNDISGIPNVTASITADNQLSITAAPGFTFSFSNDTSGALAALGMNTLFTGSGARDMGVNDLIVNDVGLLASGADPDPLVTGDNTIALAMADVQNGEFLDGGTSTIYEFYETLIVEVGVDARANREQLIAEEQLVDTFQRRRTEISGVSIDEEVTFLLQFERAFEASARVVTTTDRMLESLLAMAL